MILIIHILIALSSVAYTTSLFFMPSQSKLKISYGLVASTIISGTYLVVSRGTHILESCAIGLLYVGAISVATVYVRRELAVNEAKKRRDLT